MTAAAGSSFFADTNLLLYAVDHRDPLKQRLARAWLTALWDQGGGRLSWQVINEFYVNASGKIGAPLPQLRASIETYSWWQPIGFTLPLLQRSWHWMDRAGVPYWDSLIVAAAEAAGCSFLLSEDFQEGRKFGALTVVNPFRSSPADFGLA